MPSRLPGLPLLLLAGATSLLGACSSSSAETGVTPASTTKPGGGDDGTSPPGSSGGTSPTPKDDGGGASDAATPPPALAFPTKWIDGTACGTDPDIQTHQLTPDTFILRQSLCTTFEGPFMYLFVGSAKALLVDTGTGGVDLRSKVLGLLGGKNVQLVVAHSHSHGDHVQGDPAFRNQPNTVVVGTSVTAVRQFFAIGGDAAAAYDLGGRVVDVLPIPGHQAAHVAYYDHETKLLLTGDTLYPGRLYIDDWTAYRTSVPRLVAFVDAGRPVSYVLGGHIEMPKTGADYAFGAQLHPNEHALQLGDAELRELDAAVKGMGATPKREVHPSFIISP